LGDSTIDLGISYEDSVAVALVKHQRRRHRVGLLNEVENEIAEIKLKNSMDVDTPLWKQKERKFASSFSTKKTWLYLRSMRSAQPVVSWSQGVWFPHSTPNYSFLLWVALRNRL